MLPKGQQFLMLLGAGSPWWLRDPWCLRAGGQQLWWRAWTAPWHSLLCLARENWLSWRSVRGSTVFLYSLLGVCALVHEWGDRDMDRGYLQMLCVHCPETMAVQEKEILDSWPCAVLQICTQTTPECQDWFSDILCVDETMREIIFSQELNNCFLDERTQHLALGFHVFYHVDVTVCFVPAVMLTY